MTSKDSFDSGTAPPNPEDQSTIYVSSHANTTNWTKLASTTLRGELIEVGVRNPQGLHGISVILDDEVVFEETVGRHNSESIFLRNLPESISRFFQRNTDDIGDKQIPLNMAFDDSMEILIRDVQRPYARPNFYANFSVEYYDSRITRWVNDLEARSGIRADVIFSIIAVLLTLLGSILGIVIQLYL